MATDTKRPVNGREVATWAKARDTGLGDIDRLGREGGLLRIELPVQDVERAKCPFPRKERPKMADAKARWPIFLGAASVAKRSGEGYENVHETMAPHDMDFRLFMTAPLRLREIYHDRGCDHAAPHSIGAA
jgi:hypothetical protein